MKQPQQFIGITEREGAGYVALCPELDVASQGNIVEEARRNLTEALEVFFEAADPFEIQNRLHKEVFVTHVGAALVRTSLTPVRAEADRIP